VSEKNEIRKDTQEGKRGLRDQQEVEREEIKRKTDSEQGPLSNSEVRVTFLQITVVGIVLQR
jgi:hypothetical protein